MAFTEDEALLTEYIQWAAQKKVSGLDVTPGQFLIEKAQAGAFGKLIEAVEMLNDPEWTWTDDKTGYRVISTERVLDILES